MKNYKGPELLQQNSDEQTKENTPPIVDKPINKQVTKPVHKSTPTPVAEPDYGPDTSKLGKILTTFIVIFLVIISFILGMLAGRFVTINEYNKQIEAEKNGSNNTKEETGAVFTDIDTSEEYDLSVGDTISLKCSSKNESAGMKIEYIVNDKTTDTFLFNTTLEAGETYDFVPSDYFEDGKHTLTIIQNAYALSDSVGTDVLATDCKEITVDIIRTSVDDVEGFIEEDAIQPDVVDNTDNVDNTDVVQPEADIEPNNDAPVVE